jgi:hypothetical protein
MPKEVVMMWILLNVITLINVVCTFFRGRFTVDWRHYWEKFWDVSLPAEVICGVTLFFDAVAVFLVVSCFFAKLIW